MILTDANRRSIALALSLLIAVKGESLANSEDRDTFAIEITPGCVVEQLMAAGPDDGSWSAFAIDSKGRLIISPQGAEPLLRVTIPTETTPLRVDKLDVRVTSAMGLLHAFDGLYVNGLGPDGFGIYRLRYASDGDVFDRPKLLRKFAGKVQGEHGSHGLVVGPDGMIYLAQGNHVLPPDDLLSSSPYKSYGEDQLLSSANYGVSGGDKSRAPCGHILRMDADGQNVELFAAGFRNIYDLAFDANGELFVFDSDTEFNWGLPWYVPNRILHVVPGGDYGFREGTGKWSPGYPDSLPSVVDVGLGSPTGVRFGAASNFPAKYRSALFALDWTFGRILVVHLEPAGASYSGRFETFLQGRPLNVTDIEFGPDGAMYFITGGRKTSSALYRVRYVGNDRDDTEAAKLPGVAERGALERSRLDASEKAFEQAWFACGSPDRFLRQAGRIAIESHPLDRWRDLVITEPDPLRAVTGLLALARVGTSADREAVVANLAQWWTRLEDEELQIAALRVAEVALARHGLPFPAGSTDLRDSLDKSFPAESFLVNRELAQLLVALQAPNLIPRTLDLVAKAATFEEQMHFVFHLRNVADGWRRQDREAYFHWFTLPHDRHEQKMVQWFTDLNLRYANGASFPVYMANIRSDAIVTLSDSDRQQWADLIVAPLFCAPKPIMVEQRAFVYAWTIDELLPRLHLSSGDRSPEHGRRVFTSANCLACHRYANEGGATGPDLTTVAYKLGPREMLEALIEPSKVVSDQFQNTIVQLISGEAIVGRIIEQKKDKIVLSVDPLRGIRREILRRDIEALEPSQLSPMPTGLLNSLTKDEIQDLLAYLGYELRDAP